MAEIMTGAGHATFINTFRCDPSNQDEVVRINIDIVDQVASSSLGFISAAVHRSTDGTRVINYLQWESAEHLTAMQRSSGEMSVPQHVLDLHDAQLRVAGHPRGGSVPGVVQSPVRAQLGVGPVQHRPHRRVGQRPRPPVQGPPDRLLRLW